MKRDNLVRLTRFKVSEEKKAGITDVAHFAYPTFAKAARARRDNLTNSVKDLKVQLNAARIVQEEAESELVNAEKLEQRDEAEERRAASA